MGDAEADPEALDREPRREARGRMCPMRGEPFESAWAGSPHPRARHNTPAGRPGLPGPLSSRSR